MNVRGAAGGVARDCCFDGYLLGLRLLLRRGALLVPAGDSLVPSQALAARSGLTATATHR